MAWKLCRGGGHFHTCEVFIDRQPCYPSQTITGRVECVFTSEEQIKNVQVTFEGSAHVQFGIKNPIITNEKYCSLQMMLMKDNIVDCQPGIYIYKFSMVLPKTLPATITLDHGYVSYWITAEVELVGETILRDRKKVTIGSHLDLNAYEVCKNPVIKTEDKTTVLFRKSPALTITIKLPHGGFIPSQILNFTAVVQNLSSVSVWAVRFKVVQIFQMRAQDYVHHQYKTLGRVRDMADSNVDPGTKRSWDLQLRIPPDTLAPDLMGCNIIKMHCEVVGTVILPFPHRDLKIKVPFYLGTIPVKSIDVCHDLEGKEKEQEEKEEENDKQEELKELKEIGEIEKLEEYKEEKEEESKEKAKLEEVEVDKGKEEAEKDQKETETEEKEKVEEAEEEKEKVEVEEEKEKEEAEKDQKEKEKEQKEIQNEEKEE